MPKISISELGGQEIFYSIAALNEVNEFTKQVEVTDEELSFIHEANACFDYAQSLLASRVGQSDPRAVAHSDLGHARQALLNLGITPPSAIEERE